MRIRVTIAAAVLVVAVLVAAVVAAWGGSDTFRPPWENEDGIWDMSQLPATENVLDHTGAVVGVVETRHYETDTYPLPVLGPNGELVGHIGENGFWALGEPEPFIEDAYTVVEEFGASGELISTRTIDSSGEMISEWTAD